MGNVVIKMRENINYNQKEFEESLILLIFCLSLDVLRLYHLLIASVQYFLPSKAFPPSILLTPLSYKHLHP